MPVVICDPAKKRSHTHRSLAQLRQLQQTMFILAQNPDEDTDKRARCALAYERLEGRIAVLRGKPGTLTGRVDAEPRTRRLKPPSAVIPMPGAQA